MSKLLSLPPFKLGIHLRNALSAGVSDDPLSRRLITLVAAIVVGLGGSAVAAAPAQAATTDCPGGYLCLWTEPNFAGTRTQYNRAGVCINVAPTTSSVHNNRQTTASLFRGPDCSLNRLLLLAGQAYNPMPTGWNDTVRSIRLN